MKTLHYKHITIEMLTKKAHCITLMALVLSVPSFLMASFSAPVPTVAQGMGGSFVAKADHAGALMINPSGLSRIARPEMTLFYAEPYGDIGGTVIRQGMAALAIPLGRRFSMGASHHSFQVASLLKEEETACGWAYQVHPRLSVGANVSYLRHAYTAPDSRSAADPIFAKGNSKSAFSGDVGIIIKPLSFLQVGGSVRHFNRPDLGLAAEDRVPLEARGGLWLHLGMVHILSDVQYRDAGPEISGSRELKWSAGTELNLLPKMNVRFGATGQQMTTGLGITIGNLTLDYSFSLMKDLTEDSAAGHQMAMTYRFGKVRSVR
jgi:hypothetical protein